MVVLNKQEVQEWKANEVTKRFFNILRESRNNILEYIAAGGTVMESVDQTAQELARELGKVKAIDDILEFTVEEMIDEAVSVEEMTSED